MRPTVEAAVSAQERLGKERKGISELRRAGGGREEERRGDRKQHGK
jgi:hypothetical protein